MVNLIVSPVSPSLISLIKEECLITCAWVRCIAFRGCDASIQILELYFLFREQKPPLQMSGTFSGSSSPAALAFSCPSTHTQLVHDSRPRCSRRILAQRIGSKALLGKLKVRSSTKPLQSETHLHHRPRHCKTIIYNAAATDVFFIEGTMMTVGTLQRPFGQRIVWNHTRGI